MNLLETAALKPEGWAAIITAAATLLLGWLDRRASRDRELRGELRADLAREQGELERVRAENDRLHQEVADLRVELAKLGRAVKRGQ